MGKNRVEAFTDAVIAIVMTVLVLELHKPQGDSFIAFLEIEHELLIYLISFIMLAVYWNNHHHLFQIVEKINGNILWANNILIFTLTLFPFGTSWVSSYPGSFAPQILFGILILLANLSFMLLARELVKLHGRRSKFYRWYNNSNKSLYTIIANLIAILMGMVVRPELVILINALSLTLWIIPDKRIEKI